ncbi:hypothetical protein BH11BAC2_BH11BAC2_19310 [soil metagenome]
MNGAHWHLVLNHAPVMGIIIGTCLFAGGMAFKTRQVIHAAFLVLIAASLLIIPVFLTGEPAEDTIENLGIDHQLIHEHEEAGEQALWFVALTGILALMSFYFSLRDHSKLNLFFTLTLLSGILASGVLLRVGNLGGQIRHSEIRNSASSINKGNSLNTGSDEE